MVAEVRKWYRGQMIGENNYLFTIPMTQTEASIFFDILKRTECVMDGGYSPCLDICTTALTKEELSENEVFHDWWDCELNPMVSIGRNDKPFKESERPKDDEQ